MTCACVTLYHNSVEAGYIYCVLWIKSHFSQRCCWQFIKGVVERQYAVLPLQMPQLFEQYRLQPTRGILLHGPPGTGKTALACAVASEIGALLFVLNGPDIISEYVGESEAGLQVC